MKATRLRKIFSTLTKTTLVAGMDLQRQTRRTESNEGNPTNRTKGDDQETDDEDIETLAKKSNTNAKHKTPTSNTKMKSPSASNTKTKSPSASNTKTRSPEASKSPAGRSNTRSRTGRSSTSRNGNKKARFDLDDPDFVGRAGLRRSSIARQN